MYCVDLGDIIYIVYIVCIFTRVFLFNKVLSACICAVRSAHCHHTNRRNNTPNANMADHSVGARGELHESEVSKSDVLL